MRSIEDLVCHEVHGSRETSSINTAARFKHGARCSIQYLSLIGRLKHVGLSMHVIYGAWTKSAQKMQQLRFVMQQPARFFITQVLSHTHTEELIKCRGMS